MAYRKEGNVYWPVIDKNSPRYWEEQRVGYTRINKYHDALVLAEQEGNWREVDRAREALAASPGAVRILKAWRVRVVRMYWDSYPVVVNEKGQYVGARDIPVFAIEKRQK